MATFASNFLPAFSFSMNHRLRTLITINILSFLGFSFIVLFTLLSSSPLKVKLTVYQHPDGVPAVFSLQKDADPAQLIKIRLTLPAANMTNLISEVMAASVPGSRKYRQHLSKDQVEKLASPDPLQLQTLRTWLNGNGVDSSSIQSTGNRVSLTTNVQTANSLFKTTMGQYINTRTGVVSVIAPKISVPIDIDEFHVSSVTGIQAQRSFNTSKQSLDTPPGSLPNACGSSGITPQCIIDLYGLPSTPISPQTSVAITGFNGELPRQSDLDAFMRLTRPDIDLSRTNVTFSTTSIDGGIDQTSTVPAGDEASLDVQYVSSLAPGVETNFYSVGTATIEGFGDLIEFLLEQETPPAVLTTSYGSNEGDIPQATAQAICNDLLQLTSRGVTILAASGDGGVSGGTQSQCTRFEVTFPSSCPWVTSVGSTMGVSPEVAANFSTGGFSNYFQRPSYQHLAARKYLHSLGTTNTGFFDPYGRGTPDISAAGSHLPVVTGGKSFPASGTSFSAPIAAAVVANINARRLASGKSALGFLNPSLYIQSESGLFNDITNGSNPGCDTEGFPAATGWDPVTGLGTPNFSKLVQTLST